MLAVASFAGCGSDDDPSGGVGDLAAKVPATTPYYAEVALGEDQEAVNSLLDALARSGLEEEGDSDAGDFASGIFSGSEEELGSTLSALDYADEIEPWLGERIAIFGAGGENRTESEFAVLLNTSDAELAQEAFSSEVGDEVIEERDGISIMGEEEQAYAVLGSDVVIGDLAAVAESVEAAEADSLRESERFEGVLDELEESLAFATVDVGGSLEQELAAEPDALPPAVAKAIVEGLPFDPEGLVAFSFEAEGTSFVVEQSVPFAEPPDPEQAGDELLNVPSLAMAGVVDSSLTPVAIQVFAGGFEFGFEQEANRQGKSAAAVRALLRKRQGVDPLRAARELTGQASVFVLGPLRNPVVGISIETKSRPRDALAAAEFVLEGPGTTFLPAPPIGRSPTRAILTDALPGAIVQVAAFPGRVVVAGGTNPERVNKALATSDPGSKLEDAVEPPYRLDEFQGILPDDFVQTGFADLSALDSSIPEGLAGPTPFDPAEIFGSLQTLSTASFVMGQRSDGNDLITRYQVKFPELSEDEIEELREESEEREQQELDPQVPGTLSSIGPGG